MSAQPQVGRPPRAGLADAASLRRRPFDTTHFFSRWYTTMHSGFRNWRWPTALLAIGWLLRRAPWPISVFWNLRVTLASREGVKVTARLRDIQGPADVFGLGEYDFNIIDWDRVRTVVDMGAHVGAFTLWVAGRSNCRVLALEPNPETFGILSRNVAQAGMGDRVVIRNAAAAGEAGERRLYTARYSTDASIIREQARGPAFDVAATTLDDALDAAGLDTVDLLKIDIEGAEYEVFSSIDPGWLARVGVVIVECHPDKGRDHTAIAAKLADAGFRVALEVRPTDVLLVAWRRAPEPAAKAARIPLTVVGQEPWRVLAPPEAIAVFLPWSPRGWRRLAAEVSELPPGTPIAICDRRMASFWRSRSFARLGGIQVDREYLALPSLQAPSYYVENKRDALTYFFSYLLSISRGGPLLSLAASMLVGLARLAAPLGLVGVLVPVRLTVGRRA